MLNISFIEENLIFLFITFELFIAVIFYIGYLKLQDFFDINKCEALLHNHSKETYYAFSSISDHKKRKAIYAIYALYLYSCDLAVNEKDEAKLIELKKKLTNFVERGVAKDFRFRAIKHSLNLYYRGFNYKPYYQLIEGQISALHHIDFQTKDDFLKQCDQISVTLYSMLVPILSSYQKEELNDFSIHMGYAEGFTNRLINFKKDYLNKKIYIPKEYFDISNYQISDLENNIINDAFKKLFDSFASEAKYYYDLAFKKIDLFPSDTKNALAINIILRQELINEIREQNYDVFSKKHTLSDDKINLLIKTYYSN